MNIPKLTEDKNFHEYSQPITIGKNKFTRVMIGFDTEYVEVEDNDINGSAHIHTHCITLQLAVKGVVNDYNYSNCIHTMFENGYTSLVYQPPQGHECGLEFYIWLENTVCELLLNNGYDREDNLEIILQTFYSNAELSLFFKNKTQIKDLQDYKLAKYPQLDNGGFDICPIQGVANITKITTNESSNWHINIADIRLTTAKGSLKQLGEKLGFNKGECDFTLHDARWYFENERGNFLTYAARDAIIPMLWYENFNNRVNLLIDTLVQNDHIHIATASKLKQKYWNTAASTSDNIMKACLEHRGQYKRMCQLVDYMAKYQIPNYFVQQTKGGFNKSSHGYKPEIIQNVDGYDISSAYVTALLNTRFPLVAPNLKSEIPAEANGMNKLKDVARYLDQFGDAIIMVREVKLSPNLPENKRILQMYDKDGDAITCLQTKFPQQFTLLEIQAQALLDPRGEIGIECIYHWDDIVFEPEKNGEYKHSYSYADYLSTVLAANKEAKALYGKKSVEREVYKLMGNACIGKLAQNKGGLDPNLLSATINKTGEVNGSIKDNYYSRNYNPFFFNKITAMVRCVTGLSYALSDGIMAVTDSVICPSGKFVDSKTISDLISNGKINNLKLKHLSEALKHFEWECEHKGVTLQIYKERDYAILDFKDDDSLNNYKEKIDRGEADSNDLNNCEIRKCAHRGYNRDKRKNNRNNDVDFVLLANLRFHGKPIHQTVPKLTKFTDMLTGERYLNEPYLTGENSPGMGSYNLKFDCQSTADYEMRKRVKSICRAKGYADQFHVEKENPSLLEKIKKQAKSRINGNHNVSYDFQRLVAYCYHKLKISYRKLEAMITEWGNGKTFSRSSLNRWVTNVTKSMVTEEIFSYCELKYDASSCSNFDWLSLLKSEALSQLFSLGRPYKKIETPST